MLPYADASVSPNGFAPRPVGCHAPGNRPRGAQASADPRLWMCVARSGGPVCRRWPARSPCQPRRRSHRVTRTEAARRHGLSPCHRHVAIPGLGTWCAGENINLMMWTEWARPVARIRRAGLVWAPVSTHGLDLEEWSAMHAAFSGNVRRGPTHRRSWMYSGGQTVPSSRLSRVCRGIDSPSRPPSPMIRRGASGRSCTPAISARIDGGTASR